MLNRRAFILVALALIIVLSLFVVWLIARPPLPRRLYEIPIYIGERSQSALEPSTSARIKATWSSTDLQVKSSGKIKGSLTVTSDSYTDTRYPFRDILVIQIWAAYPPKGLSNVVLKSLSDQIPLIAQESTVHSASFRLDVPFQIPEVETDGGLLEFMQVSMLWVRIHREGGQPSNVLPPGYPVPSPGPPATIDPTHIAFLSTAYPFVLTPEYTPTPPPEGYPTIEPRYVGQILISSGGQIEPYVPTEIRLDQLPTTLSGNLIQPQALWPFGESDFDLLQWAADTIEW